MKKILIISDIPTHQPNAGNRNCILQNSRLLKDCGYDVYYLFLQKESLSQEDYNETCLFWRDKLIVYKQNKIQTFLQRLVHKLSLCMKTNIPILDIFCPWGAKKFVLSILKQYGIQDIIVNYIWLSKLLPQSQGYNTCIYTHDVFSNRNADGNSLWYSFSPNKETTALNRCNHVLAIQEREAIFYSYLSPITDIRTVFMPFMYNSTDYVHNNNVLFLSGNNEHNQKAIRSFIMNILPALRNHIPGLKLIVGGSICKKLHDVENKDCIELVGYVDDPKDFYSLGNIVINPVYSGTGLKVKTFEAISYGKITLVHPHSAAGIFHPHSAPLTICKTVDDYLSALRETTKVRFENNAIKCKAYIDELNNYIKQTYQEIL